MKRKSVIVIVLLALALLSAACGAQDATGEPGQATAMPTASTAEGLATDETAEASTTPTGAAAGETPAQATAETGTTPTVSADNGTPATDASGTAGIPQTGPGNAGFPDDLDEVLRVLRTAGATVSLADTVESDILSVPGQIVLINNQEVEFYTYGSAEQAEAQASLVADLGDPEREQQFYRMGNMLVRYAGRDTLVRDLLEDVLGAQAAGQ